MSRVVRAIILALHIPFAVWALAGFSVRPEWQFWPVMWVAVLVLFRHRNGGLETRDISLVFLRGLLSAGLIAASIYTRTPGWGLLSAVVWIHGLLGSYRDWFAVNRLGYIVIPLLLSIPVQFDGYGDFAKRLQSESLQHAHWMLDQQGYLHYLDGEVFHVAGNRIPVGEVVLNEFSVFAMLAATAFGCVLLRRRFLHGALTLTGAVVLCYLMLVCQHAAPVVAWLDYGFDPANSRFLLHLLVFVCSLVSAISLDFLLSMFLEPVPFMESEGVNPFCVLWNRFFLVTNRAMPGADDEKPRLRDAFSGIESLFGSLVAWIREFVVCWFATRNTHAGALGIPFLVVACIAGAWTVNTRVDERITESYEDAFRRASEGQKITEANFLLDRLMRSNSSSGSFRLRLVKTLLDQGYPEEARSHLAAITPSDGAGFPSARLWLVQQAGRNPSIPALTESETITQLYRAVGENPRDVDARVELAERLEKAGQTRSAEEQFKAAVDRDPTRVVSLITFLGRTQPPSQELNTRVDGVIRANLNRLRDQLQLYPERTNARSVAANLLYLLNEKEEARSLLEAGLEMDDSDELRRTLSTFFLAQAEEIQETSSLNSFRMKELVLLSLSYDCRSEEAFRFLVSAPWDQYTSFSRQELPEVFSHWEEVVEGDEVSFSDRVRLSMIYETCEEYSKAIEVLQPVLVENPGIRIRVAKLHFARGAREEAEEIATETLAEIETEEQDPELRLQKTVDVLLVTQDDVQIVELLLPHVLAPESALSDALKVQFANSVSRVFENRTDDTEWLGSPEAMELLVAAKGLQSAVEFVIPALVRLSLIEGGNQQQAVETLVKFKARGRFRFAIGIAESTEEIKRDNYARAAELLTDLNEDAPNNPLVLNNLAFALVRMADPNPVLALQYVDDALAIAPEHPDLLTTRAEVYLKFGERRKKDARADLRNVLDRHPDHELAQYLYNELFKGAVAPR